MSREDVRTRWSRVRQAAVQRKERNGGIGSFFDWLILSAPDLPTEVDDDLFERVTATLESQREPFEDPLARIRREPGTDIPRYARACAQGTRDVARWAGRPLFKTVFDRAVYAELLQDLRPRGLIEVGSGSGASALWFHSIAEAAGLDCEVVSVDLHPPRAAGVAGVSFLRGDAADLSEVLTADLLTRIPRPWLVVEDAHAHVDRVLQFFDRHLAPGDYIVVEDSADKQQVLVDFLTSGTRLSYAADNRLLDFYGINATSAANSIWRVVTTQDSC